MAPLPHEHHCFNQSRHILSVMPLREDFEKAAVLFQQLSDPTRLMIFWTLLHTEECGVNIAAMIDMSPAAVSHHLKTLKLNGLITSRRQGKEVYYRLADDDMADFAHQMLDDYFELECLNLSYHSKESDGAFSKS